MKPLQEHPHLFANGEFKLKVLSPNKKTYNIENFDGKWLMGDMSMSDNITLIARPIESMSNNEVIHILKYREPTIGTKHTWQDTLEILADEGVLLAYEQNMLLEDGIYPFDQSHFDDGTVIDSTTL